MKKRIWAIAAVTALVLPAVAFAGQPQWHAGYTSTGMGCISLGTYSKASHGLWEGDLSCGTSSARKCSRNVGWDVGEHPVPANEYNKPVKVSSTGAWSATRSNQDLYSKAKKIHVTGVFTSKTAGHGTYQVVGCTSKYSFKFVVNSGGGGA